MVAIFIKVKYCICRIVIFDDDDDDEEDDKIFTCQKGGTNRHSRCFVNSTSTYFRFF